MFTLTESFLNLRNFVANLALSRLCAFWGALLAEIWWRGAQKHFSGPGVGMSHMNMCDVAHLNVAFYIEYLRETLTLQCALCQDFCAIANRHIKVIQENHSMI